MISLLILKRVYSHREEDVGQERREPTPLTTALFHSKLSRAHPVVEPHACSHAIVKLTNHRGHILWHAKTGEYSLEEGSINGVECFDKVDMSIEVNRRIRNTWCSFRKYTLELYGDRPSAPPKLQIRILRAEVIETILYGCITWSLRVCHYDTLRQAHHSFLTRCIG